MMKLYSADLSPYSARIRMQIYAKGITDIVFELPEHFGMPKFSRQIPDLVRSGLWLGRTGTGFPARIHRSRRS